MLDVIWNIINYILNVTFACEINFFSGFDDISPEELRIEAYTAEKAGTFNNYVIYQVILGHHL